MHLADFDFTLPRELIADRPKEPREAARLLVLPAAGGFADRHIADLPQLLRPGDLLVFNDTKVIPARLVGTRGMATVEITLAHDLGGGVWAAYARGARRLQARRPYRFRRGFFGRGRGQNPRRRGGAAVRSRGRGVPRGARPPRRDAAAALHQAAPWRSTGRRSARPRRLPDDLRPRRGRRRRADRGIAFHPGPARRDRRARRRVGDGDACMSGPGTFLPVKVDDPREHPMHAEWGEISAETASRINAGARPRRAHRRDRHDQPAPPRKRRRRERRGRRILRRRPGCSSCPATGSGRSTCC